VQVKNSDGRVRTHSDRQRGALYEGPLAVMVDRQSASASEIFAGAIQDYKRGLIIGEPTFGKGTVQNVLPLSAYSKKQFKDDLGQIKITIAQFFRINGDSTQHRGVVPDIRWPFGETQAEPFGERAYDNALPWRHITGSDYITSIPSIDIATLDNLKMRHSKRIEQDTAFTAELDKYKLLAETRIEKMISLDKISRQQKRERFSQRLLDAENQIRMADGEETYPSFKEMREQQEKRRDENAYRSNAPILPDPFMLETANILNDLLHIEFSQLVESSAVISNDNFSAGSN
jgi:carboxyl-terminal processing protease